jgi:bla regulator protein BlaR1
MIPRHVTLALVITLAAGAAVAQEPRPSAEPTFEVASVKPLAANDMRQRGIQPLQPGGAFRAVGLTVREFVRVAYGVPTALLLAQVTGGPAWADTDRFEIVAKVSNAASRSDPNQQVLNMLRALLTERFKLSLHTELRRMPTYDLLVIAADGSLGARLHHSTETCIPIVATGASTDMNRMCGVRRWGPGVLGAVGSMAWLAGILSQYPEVDRVVRDRTNLTGDFNLDLEFLALQSTVAGEQTSGDARPSLFTALREQLGLKLEPAQGPIDVLVIDHVEKPTPD